MLGPALPDEQAEVPEDHPEVLRVPVGGQVVLVGLLGVGPPFEPAQDSLPATLPRPVVPFALHDPVKVPSDLVKGLLF